MTVVQSKRPMPFSTQGTAPHLKVVEWDGRDWPVALEMGLHVPDEDRVSRRPNLLQRFISWVRR